MTGVEGPADRFGHDAWTSGALPVLALDSWGIAIPQGITTLGRQGKPGDPGPDVDLSSWDAARLVSRNHAELRYAGGVLSLRDLDSANGTRLQGMTLLPQRDYPLEPGDVVVVGDVTLRVIAVRSAGEAIGTPAASRVATPATSATPDPATARQPATPRPPAPEPPTPAPLVPQPALNPSATLIPAHHRFEEEEDEEAPETSGPLGAVADRLRRRRDR